MDTNATTLQIGFHMSSLNNFMVLCEHDIMKFNGNSKVLMYSINSRGETKKISPRTYSKGILHAVTKSSSGISPEIRKNTRNGVDILLDNLVHIFMQKYELLKTTNRCNAPSEKG